MLKREDLEKLDWFTGEDEAANGSGGPFIFAPELDDQEGLKLAAGAPGLALACLDARDEFLACAREVRGSVAEVDFRKLIAQIDAALEASGVEVEP